MLKNRVVVTGLGLISPVGIGKEDFWGNLISGNSGIGPLTRFDASELTSQIAGEVDDFNPQEFLNKKEARRMDLFTQYAVGASLMALKDSGLDMETLDPYRVGVILGSGVGGIGTMEYQHHILETKGPKRVSPLTVPMMIINMAAGQVGITLGAKGPNLSVVTACASGTHAIGDAFKLIQRGDADVVFAGGSEAPLTPLAVAGFCSMKALSRRNDDPQKASRPFDKDRDGFVIAEGAVVLTLESLEHALERKATIYAEVLGYGATCDAYHITAPSPDGEGAAKSMEMAIKDAKIKANQIDYINAHGTSTDLNDKLETLAIKTVFGEAAKDIAISSTKSMTGHLLGAAGALEAAVLALTIQTGEIPPTINYENPDPDCDLNYVPNKSIKKNVNYALSNSLGFGGHNATILLGKYNG